MQSFEKEKKKETQQQRRPVRALPNLWMNEARAGRAAECGFASIVLVSWRNGLIL